MNVTDYNARWLAAWSAKDVDALLQIYAPDVRYFDQQTAAGITGHDALRGYLTGLFNATPPMRYDPDEVWATENGFCGRWYCFIGDADRPALRGFDLVVVRDGRIVLNEVYVHTLAS